MENILINIGVAFAGLVVGTGASMAFFKKRKIFDFEKKKEEARKMVKESEKEGEDIRTKTEKQAEIRKESIERDTEAREKRVRKMQSVLDSRAFRVERQEKKNNELKLVIAKNKEETSTIKEKTKRIEQKTIESLSAKTGTKTKDLKESIIQQYKMGLESEAEERLAKAEEAVKENAVKIARNILINVLQRVCSPTSVETKAILVKVPKDNIKGKIVGKDGANIKEFESLLEVDIVFNDLPNTISISGYNLVNRKIAEKAMEKLIKIRGGIDREVIKKTIKEAKIETEKTLYETGKKVTEKLGLKDLPQDLIKTIGRLQYRTSYGQNIMKHSLEVAWVSTMLGSELGVDVDTCRVAGFLHDLGKAIDQDPDVQGAHDALTKELMEKYGFDKKAIHAAWAHHDAEAQQTPEALIVKAADAVSAGRPGARQESIERYSERIHALENTGLDFEGVRKSYAISAGRELRIEVDPEEITDEQMKELAGRVADKIEEELSYPGKIKVNAIRRTNYTEIAK